MIARAQLTRIQKRPWTLQSFSHLSHTARAAWNSSHASFSAHESVGRLNFDFEIVAKLLKKEGYESRDFEQLPTTKYRYFQVCSSKIMRAALPDWCVISKSRFPSFEFKMLP
jgi:hypothetical protein